MSARNSSPPTVAGCGDLDAGAAAPADETDAPETPAAVELSAVTFGYPGGDEILHEVDLTVAPGEIVVLIGPSGCGKSTVLNLVAGMVRPSTGSLRCFGRPVDGLNRSVTYMTQKDTLLPWRNALDNAAVPLQIKGVPKKERRERARHELERVGLGDAADRRPHQLSGGMRARLALARSLLADGDIVLMDEPFAAIDALVRVRLQELLLGLWQEKKQTLIYVTHDLNEALSLGHRIVVMSARPGRISLIRAIPTPPPRDVIHYQATSEAREIYVELWGALEGQLKK
jgi:NitT/TauT family transport system ATP-binding protein